MRYQARIGAVRKSAAWNARLFEKALAGRPTLHAQEPAAA